MVFDDDFTTVPYLRKGTVPPNWSKLVTSSREKSTEEFYDLTKTWFNPISDESADETFSSNNTSNEGDTQESVVNEGASAVAQNSERNSMPSSTSASEGDSATPPSQASEGDVNEDDLRMPEMINLETAGLRRSK